jgi:hypothetical protein
MNSKLFLLLLICLLPISSFAEYRMNVKFSDPSSISFGTPSNPGEGAPEEPTDPVDACPTSFPAPTFVNGYPSVLKSGANVSYSVQITSAGGYATMAEVTSGQRYVKILTTSVSGVDYGNGAIYVGDIQGWLVKTGQTINVVVTPVAYDMQEGTVCASGTPFTLVNKSHTQLYSEAQ